MIKKSKITNKSKKIKHSFTITRKDILNFQKLSGDFNPIHTDEKYAKKHNFKTKVVYGGILLSKLSYLIGEKFTIKESLWVYLKTLFLNDGPNVIVGLFEKPYGSTGMPMTPPVSKIPLLFSSWSTDTA